ncbi:Hypothetical predicted protein [Cloeon dipterum]|uniref:Uncharacterized protein n=1 Tax=Cloeon dipterum TaxID=197152 RepID=A0A8S1DTY5_9INSE|nr:Hypothetical predicted protein [Cloeon dipterum]
MERSDRSPRRGRISMISEVRKSKAKILDLADCHFIIRKSNSNVLPRARRKNVQRKELAKSVRRTLSPFVTSTTPSTRFGKRHQCLRFGIDELCVSSEILNSLQPKITFSFAGSHKIFRDLRQCTLEVLDSNDRPIETKTLSRPFSKFENSLIIEKYGVGVRSVQILFTFGKDKVLPLGSNQLLYLGSILKLSIDNHCDCCFNFNGDIC